MSVKIGKAKYPAKKKRRKVNPNYCKDCGGKRKGYADDYFIKKCWCSELEDAENYGRFPDDERY